MTVVVVNSYWRCLELEVVEFVHSEMDISHCLKLELVIEYMMGLSSCMFHKECVVLHILFETIHFYQNGSRCRADCGFNIV